MEVTAAMRMNKSSKPKEILVYQREKERTAIVMTVNEIKAYETAFNRGPSSALRLIPG